MHLLSFSSSKFAYFWCLLRRSYSDRSILFLFVSKINEKKSKMVCVNYELWYIWTWKSKSYRYTLLFWSVFDLRCFNVTGRLIVSNFGKKIGLIHRERGAWQAGDTCDHYSSMHNTEIARQAPNLSCIGSWCRSTLTMPTMASSRSSFLPPRRTTRTRAPVARSRGRAHGARTQH